MDITESLQTSNDVECRVREAKLQNHTIYLCFCTLYSKTKPDFCIYSKIQNTLHLSPLFSHSYNRPEVGIFRSYTHVH